MGWFCTLAKPPYSTALLCAAILSRMCAALPSTELWNHQQSFESEYVSLDKLEECLYKKYFIVINTISSVAEMKLNIS
jgi:hypothetical protein